MSKVKRVLTALLAASVAATMAVGATGCEKVDDASSAAGTGTASTDSTESGSGESTGDISGELKLAVFQGGYGLDIWNQIADEFEAEHPDVTVTVTGDTDIGNVLRPQIINGDAPDFIYLASTNPSGLLQSLETDHIVMDLTDIFEEDGLKDKIIDGVLDGPTYQPYGDGKIYAAPLFFSVNGMWYDSNLFEKNSWEVPETWDDAFALADQAKEQGIAMYTYAAANAPAYNESVIWPMIATIGGKDKLDAIFNYEEGAWNDPAVTETLNIFQQMHDGGYLLEGTMGMTHTQSQQQWLQDKALFIPNGAWIQNEMADSPRADGFQFGVMAAPKTDASQQQAIWFQTEEMYIPTDAENPEAAKEFIKFLYTDDIVKEMAEATNALPPLKNCLELVDGLVDDATYASAELGLSDDMVQVSGGFANTSATDITIRSDFFQGVGSILNGDMTVADLQAQMEQESQELAQLVTAQQGLEEGASSEEAAE